MRVGSALIETRLAARAGALRRVEKSSASGTLANDEAGKSAAYFERRRSGRQSRFETRLAYDADQSGPSAHFAAQIIGQMLNAGRNHPATAGRLYERSVVRYREKRFVGIA
jgi:hypothetical protein